MRNLEKKISSREHFTDFWHRAKSWRHNKKIGNRLLCRRVARYLEKQISIEYDRKEENNQYD